MATGSHDYNVRLWDFSGMNRNMNSFRIFEPLESHPIRALSFNANGKLILVVAGGSQVSLVDRDGVKVQDTIKGDMYLKDMAKTKGHVSDI